MDNYLLLIGMAISATLIILSYVLNYYEEKQAKKQVREELRKYLMQQRQSRAEKYLLTPQH